ncbi:hypothetical protein LINPERHAP2_LOCUS23320 [Linum perenne]
MHLLLFLFPSRLSPEAMVSGKAVALHCAAAVCWMRVSEKQWAWMMMMIN